MYNLTPGDYCCSKYVLILAASLYLGYTAELLNQKLKCFHKLSR